MNKYREVECGGCAPPVQIHTDKNTAPASEGAYQVEGSYRNMDGTFGHLFHAPTQLPDGTRVFTTPPAPIPTAEVQALVERLRVSARANQDTAHELPDDLAEARWHEGIAYAKNEDADELAKLVPRGK